MRHAWVQRRAAPWAHVRSEPEECCIDDKTPSPALLNYLVVSLITWGVLLPWAFVNWLGSAPETFP